VLVFLFVALAYEVLKILNLFELKLVKKIIHFLGLMWFIPVLSTYFIVPVLAAGKSLTKWLDQG